MKRKLLLCFFVFVSLFILTGCDKRSEKETLSNDSVNGISCQKKSIDQTLEYVAVVEKERLTSFHIVSTYEYSNLDSMKKACSNNQSEEKELNAKKIYVTYKVTCNEKEQTITIDKNYDTEKSMKEKNIKEMLSYVYQYITEDGTFDVDGWKGSNKNDGFICD